MPIPNGQSGFHVNELERFTSLPTPVNLLGYAPPVLGCRTASNATLKLPISILTLLRTLIASASADSRQLLHLRCLVAHQLHRVRVRLVQRVLVW